MELHMQVGDCVCESARIQCPATFKQLRKNQLDSFNAWEPE